MILGSGGAGLPQTPFDEGMMVFQPRAVGVEIVLGEGALRDCIDETLRFVLGLDCVDCFMIGAANRDELADLIWRIEGV